MFYLFIQAITCFAWRIRQHHPIRHNVTSFVNVFFSDDNKILIKKIHVCISISIRVTVEDRIPHKGQRISSINRLLKLFRDTATVDRRQGSARPLSARTDENIDQVNDMILTQEDQPRTHCTVREISRQTKKKHLLRHNKFGLIVSQGNAATYLRCDGQWYMGFVAKLTVFLVVKKFEDRLRFGQTAAS